MVEKAGLGQRGRGYDSSLPVIESLGVTQALELDELSLADISKIVHQLVIPVMLEPWGLKVCGLRLVLAEMITE